MIKNKNKALSIFYFILGLILFMPTGTRANQNAGRDHAPVAEESTAQGNMPFPTVPAEPQHLSKVLDVLPFRNDIPAPIGFSKEVQPEANQPENQHTRGANE